MPNIQALLVDNFSGGLNLRDSPSEVANNESPDCMNVTLDERGGVVKRLGLVKYTASQLNSSAFKNAFYWPTNQYLYIQQGASIYRTDGSGTWSAALKTFTTTALIGFADFQGQIVVVHPVDGVWTSTNGTSFSQTTGGTNNMEAVRGDAIAVWQNKVWVAGDVNNPARVWRSNAADPTKWTITTDSVDLRDKDNTKVVALGTGEGLDDVGRGGLLAFKEESTYRIHDATTGAYVTLDNDYGAAGPLAVASNEGGIAAISKRGIILISHNLNEPRLVSQRIQPLFTPQQLAFGTSSTWVAGSYRDRIVFSVARFGSSVNNLTIEYHPLVGWIVPHSFGSTFFERWLKNDEKLYSGHTTGGYMYETFKSGADDSVSIASRFQTRWFEPANGFEARYRRLLLAARGSFDLYTKLNFTTGLGDLSMVNITGDAMVWNSDSWNSSVWGPTVYEDYQEFFSLGHGRSISFVFRHSGTTSSTTPKLLEDGVAVEVGAFACYGVHLDYVHLGPS